MAHTLWQKHRVPFLLSTFLWICTLIISVHKIDAIGTLHIFPSLKPFYLAFLFLFGYDAYYCYIKDHKNYGLFFLMTAPAVTTLSIAFLFTDVIHYIFHLIVGLWVIGFCTHLTVRANTGRTVASDFDTPSEQKDRPTVTLHTAIFVSLITLAFALSGLYHLNKGSFVDEKLWTYGSEARIEKYWNNILQRDWINTRPSDKPGVTLAFISGAGLLQATPSDFYHNESDRMALQHMLYVMRLPVFLFCTLMIPVFFYVLTRFFDRNTALLATTMIGLSPILIGVSRLINPDALSWVFMPLTFFNYFIYLKTRKYPWLYATGALLGASLLTKYIANLFLVFFIMEIFTGYIFVKENVDPFTYMRNKIIDTAVIIFVAITTFYIFYPGTWLSSHRLLLATIWSQPFMPVWKLFMAFCVVFLGDHILLRSKVFIWVLTFLKKIRTPLIYCVPIAFAVTTVIVLCNTSAHMPWTDFEQLLASPKTNDGFSLFAIFASGFYTLLYSVSPFVLIGIAAAIFTVLQRTQATIYRSFLWHSLLFVLVFYAGSAASLIAPTVRYQIIIYPIIFALSAYGWHAITAQRWFPVKINAIIMALFIGASFFTLWSVKPFYFSYNSILLPQSYIVNPKDMGDGNYDIAAYLNALPDAQNLKIWSDKSGVCTFFVGQCNSRVKYSEFSENGTDFDYYIVSRGSERRVTNLNAQYRAYNSAYPLSLDLLYKPDTPYVYSISPGNRHANYIRVISASDVNIIKNPHETH